MVAAYTKLEMFPEAVESCQEALRIIPPTGVSPDDEATVQFHVISNKLQVRLALAYEGCAVNADCVDSSLESLRLAIASLVKSIPPQINFKRVVYHKSDAGMQPREVRRGKAVATSTRAMFDRLYAKIYGPDGTFCVNAIANLTTNFDRPWNENSGFCRINDTDEIFFWTGESHASNSSDQYKSPLFKKMSQQQGGMTPEFLASLTREEKIELARFMTKSCIDPSLLFFYNTTTKLWRQERCSGNPPPGRHGHKLVTMRLKNGGALKVYAWGGSASEDHPEDPHMWELDVATRRWTRIQVRTGRAPYVGKLIEYVFASYEPKQEKTKIQQKHVLK